MWVTGECKLSDFQTVFYNAMLQEPTPGAGAMYVEVASNPAVEGHIFKTITYDGVEIFINCKGLLVNTTNTWHRGITFGIMNEYVPGTPGVNGTMTTNKLVHSAMANDATYSASPTNVLIKYYLSITKERVIGAIVPTLPHASFFPSVFYLGRMTEFYAPGDKDNFIALSSASYGTPYPASQGTVTISKKFPIPYFNKNWVTHTAQSYCEIDITYVNRMTNQKSYPMPIYLVTTTPHATRGRLDTYLLYQDGKFHSLDNLMMNGTEYLAVQIPGYSIVDGTNYANQFWTVTGSSPYLLLIPKV